MRQRAGGVLASLALTIAFAVATETSASPAIRRAVCDLNAAGSARRLADRARMSGNNAGAERYFLDAARLTGGCQDPSMTLVHARSLIQAAAAGALVGEYAQALTRLNEAQATLARPALADHAAADVRSLNEMISSLVVSINVIAQESM